MPRILKDVLPPDLILLTDAGMRTLSLLSIHGDEILAQKQLTRNEWTLFIVLVENYPHYAPNEILLSSLTSLSPDVCRMRMHEAQEKGINAVTRELKPVYRALSSL